MFKDDNVSISSSMDDSTYMSQTDMTLPVSDASRPFRVQVSEAMLGYSPAMSSQSQGTYHGAQSDVSQMFLPAAAAGSYLGDSNFAVAGFTNTSNDQFYGQPTGFVPRHPTAVHYPQATEGRGDHIGSAGVHRTNNLFAATSGDGSVLPSYAQKQLSSRGVVAQQAYIPYATYFNGDSNVAARSISERGRPRLRSVQSANIPLSVTSMGVSHPSSTFHPTNTTPRRASDIPHTQASHDTSSVLSPTVPATSSQQHLSPAEQGYYSAPPTFVHASGAPNQLYTSSAEHAAIVGTLTPGQPDEGTYLSPNVPTDRTPSEDAAEKIARAHPLYQASKHGDDLYHCPHEGQAGCAHKPTPLKCNYDKYVDSHLKPFRCRNKTCTDVQFSSTACLLRHEREAHGMHGHGSKPHLCIYSDCERAVPGQGFPRRYNLIDHMKRVHEYSDVAAEGSEPSPGAPPKRKQGTRKRKSAADGEEQVDKRQRTAPGKVSDAANSALAIQKQRKLHFQRLCAEFNTRLLALRQRLEVIQGPLDFPADIATEVAMLDNLKQQVTEMSSNQPLLPHLVSPLLDID
uniref:C2H2-type domain-containing protein n=1 Tax=Coniosporium apollinis TaxID=61459 RepID=A0ABQ9NT94_9PEZI|nr:hypothetical protein H2201_004629 [Coniosporium apollinis]